jgi:hypothetical protein
MKALTEKHLAIFPGHMVDVIGIHADLSSGEIGRSELDKRVLAVMRDVPRHLSFRRLLLRLHTKTRHSRSDSTRRSHSRSWWRS